MGVEKILWQKELVIKNNKFDVLIPLPIDGDDCLSKIGINDFVDTDDAWNQDFLTILRALMDEDDSVITVFNKFAKKEEGVPLDFTKIPMLLSGVDNCIITIIHKNKKITFTKGHSIFWLSGFSSSDVSSLHFPIVEIDNKDLVEVF